LLGLLSFNTASLSKSYRFPCIVPVQGLEKYVLVSYALPLALAVFLGLGFCLSYWRHRRRGQHFDSSQFYHALWQFVLLCFSSLNVAGMNLVNCKVVGPWKVLESDDSVECSGKRYAVAAVVGVVISVVVSVIMPIYIVWSHAHKHLVTWRHGEPLEAANGSADRLAAAVSRKVLPIDTNNTVEFSGIPSPHNSSPLVTGVLRGRRFVFSRRLSDSVTDAIVSPNATSTAALLSPGADVEVAVVDGENQSGARSPVHRNPVNAATHRPPRRSLPSAPRRSLPSAPRVLSIASLPAIVIPGRRSPAGSPTHGGIPVTSPSGYLTEVVFVDGVPVIGAQPLSPNHSPASSRSTEGVLVHVCVRACERECEGWVVIV
jgi:hypothetical protein